MKNYWLGTLLKLSAEIHRQKKRLFKARSLGALFIGVQILSLELLMSLLALPIGVFIKSDRIDRIDGETMLRFTERRKLTFSVVGAFLLLYIGQVLVGAFIGLLVVQPTAVDASVQTWSFNNPADYVYDATRIQIVDGIAVKPATNTQECNATLQPVNSLVVDDLYGWNSFTVSAVRGQGDVMIQLSDNQGSTWQYWNGSDWVVAGVEDYNDVETVDQNIAEFPLKNKSLLFKAFLIESCEEQMQITNIGLGYTTNAEYDASILEGASIGGSERINLTVSAWINFTELPVQSMSIVGEAGYVIGIDPANAKFYFTNADGIVNATSDLSAETGEWYYLVGTYDGIDLQLYVNGALQDTKTLVAVDAGPVLELNTVDNSDINAIIRSDTIEGSMMTSDQVALAYLEGINTSPVIGLQSSEQTETGLMLDVSISDLESNFITIEKFEVSSSGEFNGEQMTPTFTPESENTSLLRALEISPLGSIYRFEWDILSDFDVTDLDQVFIKLQATDGIEQSKIYITDPIPVDFMPPEIEILGVAYSAGEYILSFELGDNVSNNFNYKLRYSFDNKIWTTPELSDELVVGVNTVSWSEDLESKETYVELTVTDEVGNSKVARFPDYPVSNEPPQEVQEETLADNKPTVDDKYESSEIKTIDEPKILNELVHAKESSVLVPPVIAEVRFNSVSNEILIKGTGVPNSTVVLFLNSDQALMYSVKVDSSGKWEFVHSQVDFELEPGDHSVYGITLDEQSATKSVSGNGQGFNIQDNSLNTILNKFDVSTTALTVFIILLALAVLAFKFKHLKYQTHT